MKKYLLPLALLLTPTIALAAFGGTSALIDAAKGVIDKLTILLAAVALLVFFFGIAKFIRAAGDEKAIAEGRRLMVWGIVALFVMVSVWGIVAFMQTEFGLPASSLTAPLSTPGSGGGGTPATPPCGDPALDPSLPPDTPPCL